MNKTKTKLGIILALSVMVLIISGLAIAKPNTERVSATNNNGGNVVAIPAHAVAVADNVFSLGTATDADGRIIEGFMFIDRKKEDVKPQGVGGSKRGPTCYSFLASGAKWKTVEPWVVNPANTQGLSDSFVFGNLAADIQKWEDASLTNIIGNGNTTSATLVADTQSPDNINEVYFGSISDPGVIAVTIVWGIFSGPPQSRYLIEWDQVYDQVDYGWSSIGEAGKMDFENIATHELGHSVGMGHPSNDCTEETMYAYADFGETKKRSLNAGDIEGINKLY